MVRDRQHGPVVELNRIQVARALSIWQLYKWYFHGTSGVPAVLGDGSTHGLTEQAFCM
jgi:hypothetical protein